MRPICAGDQPATVADDPLPRPYGAREEIRQEKQEMPDPIPAAGSLSQAIDGAGSRQVDEAARSHPWRRHERRTSSGSRPARSAAGSGGGRTIGPPPATHPR
ncbi:hypothetical protein GCM10010251_61260 [Streptomyces aurantiogriseus]|uniref:Uncharacterized protein n=1 Tax=Streptomyces aurantiogriseus TaxID=66870 RepID=A0A918KW90_9ACTN|nr:hypothetical protein GCM10010251_61260 [Streptomyces aurantiogriseus]